LKNNARIQGPRLPDEGAKDDVSICPAVKDLGLHWNNSIPFKMTPEFKG
jgi:hypothetical protein